MVAEAKEVGKNRYRESYGRYLEDFKVGDVGRFSRSFVPMTMRDRRSERASFADAK